MFLPTAHICVHFQVIPWVTYSGQSCIAAGLSPPSILMHHNAPTYQYTGVLDRCTVLTCRVEVYLLQTWSVIYIHCKESPWGVGRRSFWMKGTEQWKLKVDTEGVQG